jgi:hypothetical protein
LSRSSSDVTFHELLLPEPLWQFLSHCEIHCTASCCEDSAFEQDASLLREKAAELDSTGLDSLAALTDAKRQLSDVIASVRSFSASSPFDQILVWVGSSNGAHDFQLDLDIAEEWFSVWLAAFVAAIEAASAPAR